VGFLAAVSDTLQPEAAMRLRVNYRYHMRYVPDRCFNPRNAIFGASTDIDVREIPRGDAIPAFRVEMPGHGRLSALAGQPRLIVSWGGRLWADTGLAAGDLEARCRDSRPGTPLDVAEHLVGVGTNVTDAASLRRHIGQRPKSWHDDGGAAMAAKLSARAEDLLLVGDRLFSREYEPCWYFDSYGNGVSIVSARPDLTDRFGAHYREVLKEDPRRTWRADRLADAGRLGMRGEAKGKIEVIDPSALRLGDDADALAAWAAAVASHLSRHLHAMPSGAVAALLDLRDALAASGGTAGPAVPDALRAIAGLPATRIPSWLSGAAEATTARDEAVADSISALIRWDARPRDGREWIEAGLPLTGTRSASGDVREILDAAEADRLSRGLGTDLGDAVVEAASGRARLLGIGHAQGIGRFAYSPASPPLAAVLAREDGSLDSWCSERMSHDVAEAIVRRHLARAAAPGPEDLRLQVPFGERGAEEEDDMVPEEEFAP
jgi:hypothetical protein